MLKLQPVIKDYIWGGTTLKDKWGKTSETDTIAECWELSSFPGAESIDAESGKTLPEIIAEHPEFFGGKASAEYFPVLVKLIDAASDLSIQVHPDDEYASMHENGSQGKTEMWYIADAKDGASIYYGFSRDVSREEVAESIQNNTITDLLQKVPVKKGDAFFVSAGTVHALLSGVTVVERVYDYDRRDKNGNPRELHVEKALDVFNYKKGQVSAARNSVSDEKGVSVRQLADCKYFYTEEIKITEADYRICPKDGFVTFTVVEGTGRSNIGEIISKGSTWLVPNGFNITVSGSLTFIATTI